jgi:membrane associated rhomboid family serine protease
MTISGWILAINIVVYVLGHILLPPQQVRDPQLGGVYAVLPSPVDAGLAFSYATAIQQFQVWRFVTFQFVHANLIHIAGNMMALMALGPVVESYLGRRRFLAFYLLCGIVGPIAFLVLMAFAGRGVYPANAMLVGASAGVFGVLVGAAIIAPREWVQLIFPPTPVRLRTAAILMLCVAGYTVFVHGRSAGFNAGGEAGAPRRRGDGLLAHPPARAPGLGGDVGRGAKVEVVRGANAEVRMMNAE